MAECSECNRNPAPPWRSRTGSPNQRTLGVNSSQIRRIHMEAKQVRSLMISNGWIQAACAVLIVGFLIMGILTYYTYSDEPPIPEVVKDSSGATLFTRADVMNGQSVFLSRGLMEYGSIFGHGAYLGP